MYASTIDPRTWSTLRFIKCLCVCQVCREALLELIAQTISIFEQQQQQKVLKPEPTEDSMAGASPPARVENAVAEDTRPLKVLVEQGSLYNAWGQQHLRTKFPTWEELRKFDRV